MIIKRAILLMLIKQADERGDIHHVIVSGEGIASSRIDILCKTAAQTYLQKHPEYELAYHDSWEYLGRELEIEE